MHERSLKTIAARIFSVMLRTRIVFSAKYNVKEVNLEIFLFKFYGRYGDLIQQYDVSLSRMLNDILTLDQLQWPIDQTFHQFYDPDTEHDHHGITSGFPGAFATGVACQQGKLTLRTPCSVPPFGDLFMLQLLRPVFPNLPCLFATFRLDYPQVLSRFYFEHQ